MSRAASAAKAPHKSAPKAASAKAKPTAAPAKKVSANLIATIEKRRAEKEKAAQGGKPSLFGRPAGRRGRRPRRPVEYTPTHTEEGGGGEGFDFDAEYEKIEYDTGIRVEKPGGGEDAFSLDRVEDFDEELNFDR